MNNISFDIEDIIWTNWIAYESCQGITKRTITSVDIVKYTGLRSDSIVGLFVNNHLSWNQDLREGKTNTNCNTLSLFINKAPTLAHPIILYRGISVILTASIGDVLTNLGFMFCSLHMHTGLYYTNNTIQCYQKDRCDITKVIRSPGTLFVISVPPNIPMLDVSYYDHNYKEIISEVILDMNIRLKITDIIDLPSGNRQISCDLLV